MSAERTWSTVLGALAAGEPFGPDDARWAMDKVMSGEASPAQIAALSMGLRCRGASAEVVAALVQVMVAESLSLEVPGTTLDIVGTGGDRSHSVNLSTLAALVCAGAGATVVKHGNRAASSKCGSADVLEELGVSLDLPPESVAQCVSDVGIGFCFAPVFHPALRHAAVARRELGIATVFNILGPLANPAQPSATLVGAADALVAPVMAGVFAEQGRTAVVVRGLDGLDEVTVSGPTAVWDATGASLRELQMDPVEIGMAHRPTEDLRGGDAKENAQVVRDILAGESAGRLGTIRDAVLLNAATALAAYDAAAGAEAYGPVESPLVGRVRRALPVAAESVASGAARSVLDRWVALSGRLSARD